MICKLTYILENILIEKFNQGTYKVKMKGILCCPDKYEQRDWKIGKHTDFDEIDVFCTTPNM